MASEAADEAQISVAADFLGGPRQTGHRRAPDPQPPSYRLPADEIADGRVADDAFPHGLWLRDTTDTGEPSRGLVLGLLVSIPLWSLIGAAIYFAAR